jgi:hypothetical protein
MSVTPAGARSMAISKAAANDCIVHMPRMRTVILFFPTRSGGRFLPFPAEQFSVFTRVSDDGERAGAYWSPKTSCPAGVKWSGPGQPFKRNTLDRSNSVQFLRQTVNTMPSFSKLEVRDCLILIQIVVALFVGIPAFVALILLIRQLRVHTKALILNALAARHQLFFALTDTITVETESAALLHAKDQFDLQVFEDRYMNKPDRIRSYLLMKRKYLYLLSSSHLVESGFPVRETTAAEQWIRELGEYHEFHDVHARHSYYYPEFSAVVARIIGEKQPTAWMCE